MESILLDEDLQPLWPREHQSHDAKRKHLAPLTPTLSSSHDPTFSPPLKRKKDPLPPSDRNTKSQRLTDHLTARLASSLHVSSSTEGSHHATPTNQTGLEDSRGFHRIQAGTRQSTAPGLFDAGGLNLGNHPLQVQQLQHQQQYQNQPLHLRNPSDTTLSEPRKYRKAVRNRSNPTTPVSSHPPSPGPFFQSNADDPFSSGSPASSPFFGSSLSGKAYESFARNTTSSNIFPDPKRPGRVSDLLMRRESRSSQQLLRGGPALHHLAMATRLALLHRIHSTTKSAPAQVNDMDEWIMEQTSKRGFPDRQVFESAMSMHSQVLVAALRSFGDGFQQKLRQSFSQHQEFSVYNTIQGTVDGILEKAQWLCGPEFEMGINRICSEWSAHERSVEQIVHYVQVVESMRETLSGRFQHPEDLAEDLTRSQEVIDYQRTLFGETLRNHGLEWRALGLPPMEDLILGTQDWILNMAKTLTVKIRAEVNLSMENTGEHRSATDSPGMDMMDDEDATTTVSRPIGDVMDLVIQGALLTESCLELAGKQCPMLVTSWMELASQYWAYALAKRRELVVKAHKSSASASAKKFATAGQLFSNAHQGADAVGDRKQHHQHPHQPSGVSRGVFLKTMELFENLSRLLQCVMEMREEEEESRGDGLGFDGEAFDDDDSSVFHGASAASSDQDDSMDIITTPSSTTSQSFDRHFDQYHQPHQPVSHHRPSRGALNHLQRRMPIDPMSLQRWAARESLAAVLVETGLDLCESMAETLGSGQPPTAFSPSLAPSSLTLPSTSNSYSFGSIIPAAFGTSRTTPNSNVSFSAGTGSTPVLLGAPSYTSISSSARAAAAITSLTTFAGGGAMASGTGGIGLIYVQFVVRLLSKIIEFAGQDPQQEQRLVANGALQPSSNAARSTSSPSAASSTTTMVNPTPAVTTTRPVANNRQLRRAARNADIGSSTQTQQQQPALQGLDRTVRVPMNINTNRVARQRQLLNNRRGIPPRLSNFTQLLDTNTTHKFFRFANKYRPETRAQNKTRRKTQKAIKAAKAVVDTSTAMVLDQKDKENEESKDKGKGKTKAVDTALEYNEDWDKPPYFLKYGMNHCAALAEKQKARLIVMSDDVEPAEVLIWLPALCRKNNVPYAIVKGRARLGTLVNKQSTTAIAFTEIREEDLVEFSQLVDAINACYSHVNQQPARRAWMGGLLGFKSRVKVALRATEALNRQMRLQQQQQQQQEQQAEQHQPQPTPTT
ncbi:60S ribosomal protein L8B [Mortierella sp. 14UC]|nr:60S ribosomal protein L8B [Mortierella sp. 14UC]